MWSFGLKYLLNFHKKHKIHIWNTTLSCSRYPGIFFPQISVHDSVFMTTAWFDLLAFGLAPLSSVRLNRSADWRWRPCGSDGDRCGGSSGRHFAALSADECRVYSSCWAAATVVAACRLTLHLFCLPVLAVSCRIVLICAKRSLYAAFSVLPYGESSQLRYKEAPPHLESTPSFTFTFRHLVLSIVIMSGKACLSGIMGWRWHHVTLSAEQWPKAGRPEAEAVVCGSCGPSALSGGCGAGLLWKGKCLSHAEEQRRSFYYHMSACFAFLPPQTVSYAQFLYTTNALVRLKSASTTAESCPAQTPQTRLRFNGHRNFTPARLNNSVAPEPCKAPFYAHRHTQTQQWPHI